MKQIVGFMFAMILLPIASFGAEYSFADLLKREINVFANEYFEIDKEYNKKESELTDNDRKQFDFLLSKLDLLCYECGYKKSYEIETKETGEILLRKYSGKIGGDKVSFFIQIDKGTNSIIGGVIALPNEPMMPLKLIRILSDTNVGGYTIGMELTPKLELQIVYDRKLTTLAPQCPAQNLCSYIQDEEIMYFPSLQIAVFIDQDAYEPMKAFEAKTYEEARQIVKYENRKSGFSNFLSTSMRFVNDSYMSFFQSCHIMGGTSYGGIIFDIKTKKFVNLENMFKTGIPYSLYCKYSNFYDSSCNEPCKYCPKEIGRLSMTYFDLSGYIDGFHYGYIEFVGEANEEELLIPLKELKPYMKAKWYNYLIGKRELPKDAKVLKD